MCKMQDHNQHKATFKNLVDFIEGQSRAMLDPIFGDIHNSTESSKVASRPKTQKTLGEKALNQGICRPDIFYDMQHIRNDFDHILSF